MEPDAKYLLQWLLALGFLLGIIVQVITLLQYRRTQRREVSFTAEYASKQEIVTLVNDLAALEGRLDTSLENIRSDVKSDLTQIGRDGEQRSNKIHERLDTILKAVSRLEGRNGVRYGD